MWSDVNIQEGLAKGLIKIEPWTKESLQPASVDVRLGNVFYRFQDNLFLQTMDVRDTNFREKMLRFEAKNGSVEIYPQQLLLGSVQEKVSLSNCVVARIEGKSSLARLGLTIHATGGFIDPGNQNLNITLEIVNHSPMKIRLHVGMWIAQLAFSSLDTPCEKPYGPEIGSRYYADSEPVPSRVGEKLGSSARVPREVLLCQSCGNPLDERFHSPITGKCLGEYQ